MDRKGIKMKKLIFKKGFWENELTYANSFRYVEMPEFVQEDDHVHNRKISEERFGYDNISLMTREKLPLGTKISTTCSFDNFGAPLIVIAEDLILCDDGKLRYGEYYEIVLYENGVNVWRMHMDENRKVTWHKALGVEFAVAAMEKHELTVETKENYLVIEACGHKMTLRADDLKSEFHVGIDACEGINRFYELTIE